MTTDNRTNDDRENLIARLTASINPLDVTCGECGSKPGKRCYGNGEMRRTHSSRASKAERALRIEAADALVAAQGAAPAVSGSTSDGYHTFDELYEYRMLYNAHAAHGWLAAGIPVVKSWRHSDGEECFGGGRFIVTATLPSGQVSNHYKAEHWELFKVPEVDLPPEYDGHTPQVAAERLRAAQGAARPVNSFDTTAEHAKNGADSLHVAPQEPCPQPCECLSAEDAREGRDCREHPCTCLTAPSSDREKLIEEARAVAGPKSLYAHTSVAHLLTRLADALVAAEYKKAEG